MQGCAGSTRQLSSWTAVAAPLARLTYQDHQYSNVEYRRLHVHTFAPDYADGCPRVAFVGCLPPGVSFVSTFEAVAFY